jgi:hypothetical protein
MEEETSRTSPTSHSEETLYGDGGYDSLNGIAFKALASADGRHVARHVARPTRWGGTPIHPAHQGAPSLGPSVRHAFGRTFAGRR